MADRKSGGVTAQAAKPAPPAAPAQAAKPAPPAAPAHAAKPAPPHTNRLARETSPYLLQHAHNPVDWYPWGPEALETARREEKPIFLSIGYAACHWCHVMERESFEDEAIARVINENFVPVKVDREERPDLDEIYMTATQLMTGQGGWPTSVFLTPDLKPFFAGTYFPPVDSRGMPGFSRLCEQLGRAWRERRAEVERTAQNAAETVAKVLAGAGEAVAATGAPLSRAPVSRAVARLRGDFDPVNGGFGRAPKFPPAMRLALFLREYRRSGDAGLRTMIDVTLDHMARGGMYDQVGGGFHRYSVDELWLVPHFEKMLYDNALLAWVYLDAGEALGNPSFLRTARQVLDDVVREFTHPEGGITSTLDADSEGEEGKYYVWTPAEVIEVLGAEEGALFNRLFGISAQGNFEEGVHPRRGRSIPNLLDRSLSTWARELGTDLPDLEARVDSMRARLLEERDRRVPPGLDDKILAAWNGLMIRALARGFEVLGDARYREAAERAAEFLLTRMRRDGRLLRTFRERESAKERERGKPAAQGSAFLEDYAFIAVGLLHLHAATGETRWLEEARSLVATMDRLFWDEAEGGYFFTAHDHEALIARAKGAQDDAIPSGPSMAALAQVRLFALTGEEAYRQRAERLIALHLPQAEQMPAAFPTLLLALDELLALREVRVEAAPPAAVRAGEEFTVAVRLTCPPGWHVIANDPTHTPAPPHPDTVGTDRDTADLVATRLVVRPLASFETVGVRYPEGEMSGDGGPAVYRGDVTLEAALRAAPGLAEAVYTVEMELTYQACTERECRPPATVRLSVPVRVVG